MPHLDQRRGLCQNQGTSQDDCFFFWCPFKTNQDFKRGFPKRHTHILCAILFVVIDGASWRAAWGRWPRRSCRCFALLTVEWLLENCRNGVAAALTGFSRVHNAGLILMSPTLPNKVSQKPTKRVFLEEPFGGCLLGFHAKKAEEQPSRAQQPQRRSSASGIR